MKRVETCSSNTSVDFQLSTVLYPKMVTMSQIQIQRTSPPSSILTQYVTVYHQCKIKCHVSENRMCVLVGPGPSAAETPHRKVLNLPQSLYILTLRIPIFWDDVLNFGKSLPLFWRNVLLHIPLHIHHYENLKHFTNLNTSTFGKFHTCLPAPGAHCIACFLNITSNLRADYVKMLTAHLTALNTLKS
jgi:hypothetical protein